MAEVLRHVGLDVGHERDGPDGCVGAVFWTGKRVLDDYDVIWHQVRDPLKVIASNTTCRETSFAHMYKQIGVSRDISDDPVVRAMRSWLDYTDWADGKTDRWYRIEDLPTVWGEIMMSIDRPYVQLPVVCDTLNKRFYKPLDWSDLEWRNTAMTCEIIEKAKTYGYL
jgi:hypothetical protein